MSFSFQLPNILGCKCIHNDPPSGCNISPNNKLHSNIPPIIQIIYNKKCQRSLAVFPTARFAQQHALVDTRLFYSRYAANCIGYDQHGSKRIAGYIISYLQKNEWI